MRGAWIELFVPRVALLLGEPVLAEIPVPDRKALGQVWALGAKVGFVPFCPTASTLRTLAMTGSLSLMGLGRRSGFCPTCMD